MFQRERRLTYAMVVAVEAMIEAAEKGDMVMVRRQLEAGGRKGPDRTEASRSGGRLGTATFRSSSCCTAGAPTCTRMVLRVHRPHWRL